MSNHAALQYAAKISSARILVYCDGIVKRH